MKGFRLFSSIFALFGIGMLAGAVIVTVNTINFLRVAVTTQGVVYSYQSSRSDDGTTYYPLVRYHTAGGAEHTFKDSVGSSSYRFNINEGVTVLYDPANPAEASIDSAMSLWFAPIILGFMGTIFTGVGLGITGYGIAQRRKATRLLAEGIALETRFKTVALNTHLRVNKRHPYRIITTWRDPSTKQEREFRSENLWEDPSEHVQDSITVYIERGNPRRYYMDVRFLPESTGRLSLAAR